MANLKDIRKRILSVKSTEKITRAMKMVAAAKLRRAQEAIINTRPYARRIDALIKGQTEALEGYMHPLMLPREEVKAVALLIISSDRGLCGGFNANLFRTLAREIPERWPDTEVNLYLIGRKASDYYRSRPVKIIHRFTEVYTSGARFEEADAVTHHLTRDLEDGKADELWVLYNEFKSAMSQKVALEKLAPITPDEEVEAEIQVDYKYEPDRKGILDELVPQHLSIQIYRCLLESLASEHGARMTAMEGATKNAGEMIDKLTLQYNRARQAAITKELMEIIGGAEALKA